MTDDVFRQALRAYAQTALGALIRSTSAEDQGWENGAANQDVIDLAMDYAWKMADAEDHIVKTQAELDADVELVPP